MEKELPVINKELLNDGPPELVEEIITMLRQQLPENQRHINHSCSTQDWKEARAQLHKLQGSCAYSGLARLGAVTAELYSSIKNENTASQNLLDRFNTEIEAVLRELKTIHL